MLTLTHRLISAALIAPLLCLQPAAADDAKQVFGHKDSAAGSSSEAFGFYSKGCLSGAVRLPETGPTWQAMRLSRNRNWGHPKLIDFVKSLSRTANQIGWAGLYVGDLSQPRGGPMLTGHASHQIGLDADIWMLPPKRLDLSRQEREELSSISIRSQDRRSVNDNWTWQHHEIIKAAAKDPRVQRIFVNAVAKQQMCRDAGSDRAWLRKIRPWWGHHYHFHVRLHCPPGERGCIPQNATPAGDGCDETLAWWTSDEVLNPKPKPKPKNPKPAAPKKKRALQVSDLPQECRVLASR